MLTSKRENTKKIIPIDHYDFDNNCYVFKDNSLMDIISITPRDVENSRNEDVKIDFYRWCKLYQTYEDDIKILALNYPINVDPQIKFLGEKIKNTNGRPHKKWLLTANEELKILSEYGTKQYFALMIFAENVHELDNNRVKLNNALLTSFNNRIIENISYREKQNITFKICNKNLKIDEHRILRSEDDYISKTMIAEIQPQGGISFKNERYSMTGNGYDTCIHIFELPQFVSDYWFHRLFSIENAIVMMDVATYDRNEVKRALNRSIGEQKSRYNSKGADHQVEYDAFQRIEEMQELYNEINSMGEVVKLLKIRIYLTDSEISLLEARVREVMKSLEGDEFRNAIFLNEEYSEWSSLWLPYKKQSELPFFIRGNPITSENLSYGTYFHFSELQDPYASFLGTTNCGGNVLFNQFTITDKRISYSGVMAGDKGSGKSTDLKKLFKDRAMRGDYVRSFDVSGEFRPLTSEFGGTNIDCTQYLLNFLEILKYADLESDNYTRHISKCKIIYRLLRRNATEDEVVLFSLLLRGLYEKFELVYIEGRQITGLPADKYPILDDLIDYIDQYADDLREKAGKSEVDLKLLERKLLRLEDIHLLILDLVRNYGNLLNGHTTINNITDIKIVNFDISKLKELDANIFDAVVYNMIMLCQDSSVTNGKIMYQKYKRREIEFKDITRSTTIIDESHRWINANKVFLLDLMIPIVREDRKYFSSYWFATQSIRDFVPQNANKDDIEKLKILFELTSYQFIFRQSENVVPLIKQIFGGTITESHANRIPYLGKGEAILVVSNERSLELKIALSEEEEVLFGGGI